MSSLAEVPFISVEDYLAGEDVAPIKHEYLSGRVFAMAGAGDEHVTIAGNLFAALRVHLRGTPCRVYIADMKLRVERAQAFFYPDVFVTCDESDASRRTAKERAKAVIEVLSEGTEAYDRGAKFECYRRLETLEDYILVDSRRRAIEVFRRHADGWLLQPVAADGRLTIASLGFSCAMAEVYEDVRFEADLGGEPLSGNA